mgnify:CR=1 FL=1
MGRRRGPGGGRRGLLLGEYESGGETAKGCQCDGTTEEGDGKIYMKGTVRTQDAANKNWVALKTSPDWKNEVVADSTATGPADETYTVKAGDTLSKIAKQLLGDANSYPAIFDANRDQLSDPDKIKPGQVLKIPQGVKK